MTMGEVEAYDIASEIVALADMLAILFSGIDAESCADGARLVALDIGAKAERIKEAVKRD